jgi:threonine dehydrogenase-like Zn-dependent dehydrogenase
MSHSAIAVIEREKAALVEVTPPGALGPNEVRGKTLYTLISPGTELAAFYQGSRFPGYPGYAAVFQVEQAGAQVQSIGEGDLLFCMGRHQSFQQVEAISTLPVPDGLAAPKATIARLMGVTMTTLMTTTARPGDRVVISGAGPVGFLAAHQFAHAGYEVAAVEPDEKRRRMLVESGISQVYASMPIEDRSIAGQVALVVECSGHEQAVLDACKMVKKRGEVALVGVPWKRRTDLLLHDLLWVVFHNYIVLRSGWEWELPMHSASFQPYSIFSGYQNALSWLKAGKIPVDGLMKLVDPHDAQATYQHLLRGTFPGLFAIFDWHQIG